MKKTLCLMAVLIALAAPSRAEFTAGEKVVASRMAQTGVDAANVVYYIANDARAKADETNYKDYANAIIACNAMHLEAREGAGWLVGSNAINNSADRDHSPENRIARAKHYYSRTYPYRWNKCQDAREKLGMGSSTPMDRVANYVTTYLPRLDEHEFLSEDPPEWPFFVLRPGTNVGLHGDFEKATEKIARGMGYLSAATDKLALVWRDQPYVPNSENYIRNYMLGYRDTMKKLAAIQFDHYHIKVGTSGGDSEMDEFDRLFKTMEIALVQAGKHLAVQERYALHSLSKMGYKLTNVLSFHGDGWQKAVDEWSWEAMRFPCIEGFPSRCEEDGLQ